jgi:orotate phosphoribosyltransferase
MRRSTAPASDPAGNDSVTHVTSQGDNMSEPIDRMEMGRRISSMSTLHGEFLLRSGQTATRYFDKYQFESQPDVLRPLAAWMNELVDDKTDLLAGLEMGGVPLATAMSLQSGMPLVFVRKQAKSCGTRKAIEGPNVEGKNITVVEDVVTTGGQIVQSVELLREAGAKVTTVVCAIWRGNDLTPLTDAGLELRWTITPDNFDS